ncbi:hypothetical protein T439DRAFT_327970 [Meredithblackwellia eburnea MCA 4105]
MRTTSSLSNSSSGSTSLLPLTPLLTPLAIQTPTPFPSKFSLTSSPQAILVAWERAHPRHQQLEYELHRLPIALPLVVPIPVPSSSTTVPAKRKRPMTSSSVSASQAQRHRLSPRISNTSSRLPSNCKEDVKVSVTVCAVEESDSDDSDEDLIFPQHTPLLPSQSQQNTPILPFSRPTSFILHAVPNSSSPTPAKPKPKPKPPRTSKPDTTKTPTTRQRLISNPQHLLMRSLESSMILSGKIDRPLRGRAVVAISGSGARGKGKVEVRENTKSSPLRSEF